MTDFSHTFSICAYKESPYLEECILSTLNQTRTTNVIICTSTPNAHIENISRKYNVSLYIRDAESNIRDDWNYAYDCAHTDYVTIAHQDDVYSKDYTSELFQKIQKNSKNDFLIFLTDYRPLKQGGTVCNDINCRLRKILRSPLNIDCFSDKKFIKKAILSFGNSICCPSVTYNKKNLPPSIFTSEYSFNIDWDTFLKLAEENGRFLYSNKPLTYYRIHNESTSKDFIENNKREAEDVSMFQKFWPNWLTKIIMFFYKYAYRTYNN